MEKMIAPAPCMHNHMELFIYFSGLFIPNPAQITYSLVFTL